MRKFGKIAAFAAVTGLVAFGRDQVIAQTANRPLQRLAPLEARIPVAPTAFTNGGNSYTLYELYLTNFSNAPLMLEQVEIFDPVSLRTLASFSADQLGKMMRQVGDNSGTPANARRIAGGGTGIVFVMLKVADNAMPSMIRHRITTDTLSLETATTTTHSTKLAVIGPPVQGDSWRLDPGPGNDSDHRRGILYLDGKPTLARRYAIDWIKEQKGVPFAGDERENRSNFGFGANVLAVADGVVTRVQDGIAQNVPGTRPKLNIDSSLCGNFVVLNIGNGQSAFYLHLQAGSLRVKAGDRVRKGQVIGLLGNSGDSKYPHLHFQVVTGFDVNDKGGIACLQGEGVPFVMDAYRVTDAAGRTTSHQRELPFMGDLVAFPR